MDEPKTETIEEEAPDIPTEEIMGAINEELEAVADEEQPAADEPEAIEPEDAPPVADEEVAASAEAEPDGEPEERAVEEQPPPEDQPATEAAEAAESSDKPSDEFGALEEGTPERTRERFEAIKGKYDEIIEERDIMAQERDAVRAEADQWVQAITKTGTNPEQFGMTLEYLDLVNSGKPENLEKAYNIMQGEMQELGKMLGKPVPGSYNPLDEQQDLKQKVEDGVLSEDDALELTKARAAIRLSETTTASQAQATAYQDSVNVALAEVKQLGIDLKARDPNFEAKVEILTPIVESVVASGAHPTKWKAMIEATYAKIPEQYAPPTAAPAPKPKAPDPIRPTGTSSSAPMQAEPGSTIEAINQALERGY